MKKINAEQIIRGFVKYLNTEIIPCIDDTFTKILLRTFTITTESNADVYVKAITDFAKTEFISDILHTENEVFEIEAIIDAIRQAMNECGELTVKIPPIKFISPKEQTLSFNAADVSKLKQYLTNEIEIK